MGEYILVIDEGTTSTRAMLFAADGRCLGTAQRDLTQHYPRPGWVEHDPEEIWTLSLACAVSALALSAPIVMISIAIGARMGLAYLIEGSAFAAFRSFPRQPAE